MSSASIFILSLVAVITSCVSMIYELAIAHELATLTDEIIWWETCTLGFFIASAGLGVFYFDKLAKHDAKGLFIQAQSLQALTGMLALPLVAFTHILYRIYIVDHMSHSPLSSPLNWIMLCCQSPNILIGFLSGLELSILLRATHKRGPKDSKLILALYHLGALLASLAFALCLHKKCDPFYLTLTASLFNTGIYASLSLRKANRPQKRWQAALGLGSLVLLAIAMLLIWPQLKDLQIRNFYYNKFRVRSDATHFEQTGPVSLDKLWAWHQTVPKVKRQMTSYQSIDLVPNDDASKHWALFLDGHFQFSSETEKAYHETLVHVPIMATKIPRRILVLGAGDGLLIRELLKYDEHINSIDLVELDPAMIELATSSPLVQLNARSLMHPKVHIHKTDAFTWLKGTQKNYDAIFVDFPYPYTYDGLRLYSVEFLSMVQRKLAEGAFAAVDMPLFEAGSLDWKNHVAKLFRQAHFAGVYAIRGDYSESFILALNDKDSASLHFVDRGVPLETLDRDWFSKEERSIKLEVGSAPAVNSILKPTRLSLKDIWK